MSDASLVALRHARLVAEVALADAEAEGPTERIRAARRRLLSATYALLHAEAVRLFTHREPDCGSHRDVVQGRTGVQPQHGGAL